MKILGEKPTNSKRDKCTIRSIKEGGREGEWEEGATEWRKQGERREKAGRESREEGKEERIMILLG